MWQYTVKLSNHSLTIFFRIIENTVFLLIIPSKLFSSIKRCKNKLAERNNKNHCFRNDLIHDLIFYCIILWAFWFHPYMFYSDFSSRSVPLTIRNFIKNLYRFFHICQLLYTVIRKFRRNQWYILHYFMAVFCTSTNSFRIYGPDKISDGIIIQKPSVWRTK